MRELSSTIEKGETGPQLLGPGSGAQHGREFEIRFQVCDTPASHCIIITTVSHGLLQLEWFAVDVWFGIPLLLHALYIITCNDTLSRHVDSPRRVRSNLYEVICTKYEEELQQSQVANGTYPALSAPHSGAENGDHRGCPIAAARVPTNREPLTKRVSPPTCFRHNEDGGAEVVVVVAARGRQPPAQTRPRPGMRHAPGNQARNRGAASSKSPVWFCRPPVETPRGDLDAACGVASLPRFVLPSRTAGKGPVQFPLREN